jgi:hypothetical protein
MQTVGRTLFSVRFDIWSVSVVNQVVFLLWGMLTGLMVGLGQALVFTWKFRVVLGRGSYATTWQAGALWVGANAGGWAIGLAISSLAFAAVTPALITTIPDYEFAGELTPWVFLMQMISMVLLSLPVGAGTGATLAWLLRHSDKRASHKGSLIPRKAD